MTFQEADDWTEWLLSSVLVGTNKGNPYMTFIKWWIRDRPDLLGMLEVQGGMSWTSDLRDGVFCHIRHTLMDEEARATYQRIILPLSHS